MFGAITESVGAVGVWKQLYRFNIKKSSLMKFGLEIDLDNFKKDKQLQLFLLYHTMW